MIKIWSTTQHLFKKKMWEHQEQRQEDFNKKIMTSMLTARQSNQSTQGQISSLVAIWLVSKKQYFH